MNFQFYPKNIRITPHLNNVVKVFEKMENEIATESRNYKSNEILAACKNGLTAIGYKVEGNHNEGSKHIEVAVLFGRNNVMEKSFRADAYNSEAKSVIEVEAGRGVLNNQFLKDLFQACMMQDVEYLTIAVLNKYRILNNNKTKFRENNDFEEVCKFFDALYSSERLKLPLKGILVIGYDTPLTEIVE
ncbi:hypothetical protein MH215_25480 [Paenibacillus sp. ACRSA]|uniref:hypothetical protein n=1 Tax=Paenibacillus sp. ACRSA TaxID=2918211 RepID=UPI001EF6482B|nr:hypothetical protein [Paenibacillus sp. ACRSA]MCG7380332.1 hypothetical protein [Paenibacillus sp. ACRSA]